MDLLENQKDLGQSSINTFEFKKDYGWARVKTLDH